MRLPTIFPYRITPLIVLLTVTALGVAAQNLFAASATNAPTAVPQAKPSNPFEAPARAEGMPAATPPSRTRPVNPFELEAAASYVGRFSGPEVDLRLVKSETGEWNGTLRFHGNQYRLEAHLGEAGLVGKFGVNDQSWPFTAVADGDTLAFTSEGVTTRLQRRLLPELKGQWRSQRVLIRFGRDTDKIIGRMQFKGQEYSFEAEESAGDLEGRFKAGDSLFPFSIANEAKGLVFRTGAFSELLAPVADKGKLRVQTVPEVPFTLLCEGKALVSQNGVFELAGGQDFPLEISATGYKSARTNLMIPSYSETTWTVALQQLSFPSLKQPWTNSLGMPLVPVSGTKVLFAIWDVRVRDYAAYAAANSGVDGSWKDPQYEGEAVTPQETCPVVNVSWNDAKAFCEWLTKEERSEGKISDSHSYRLPQDWEWSVAVGLDEPQAGTPQDKDSKIKDVYPWGTQWPPPNDAGNYDDCSEYKISGFRDGFERTSPVGSFKANKFRLYDMGGNVWQWCEDWYDGEQKYRVMRGASWFCSNPDFLLSWYRYGGAPEGRNDYLGFRCVLAMEASP